MRHPFLRKIFLILFLDLFAFSAIIPLLPLLFLDATYFLRGYSHAERLFYLGLLYAVYPLFQVIGSPLWYKLSDRLGRKAMLQLCFLGNALGYILSAYGLWSTEGLYLFIGNSLAGFLGVNIATIQALVSDHYEGIKRVKYFGFVNLMLGGAFAIGPYISSLCVAHIPHVETVAFFLFVLAALVGLFNLILISTIKTPLPQLEKETLVFFEIKKMGNEAFYPLALVFLTTFGWYIFIKTFQVFLLESENFSARSVLKWVSFYGISTLVAQGAFVLQLYKRLLPYLALLGGLGGLAISILILLYKPVIPLLPITLFAIAFFQSLIAPHLLAIFSKEHHRTGHGQMMSAYQGVVSLAKIIAPLAAGLFMVQSPSVALGGSVFMFIIAFVMGVRLVIGKTTIVKP